MIDNNNLWKLKGAIATIEFDIENFRKMMVYVDSFNELPYTKERFWEVKKICKVIFANVPFMISKIDKITITRARKNEGPLFSHQNEISYNINFKKVFAGRFNLDEDPVFYGCLPTYDANGRKINYDNQCPMFEVCKEINTHQGLKFPLFFTLGFWELTKPISVLNLCFEDEHLTSNVAISSHMKRCSDYIKNYSSEKVFEFIQSVWKYFSSLTRRWDKSSPQNYYYILTAFYAAFSEHYKEINEVEGDAIIYPSAMTQAKGLNIVLRPSTVDNFLKLTQVQVYTLKNRGLPYDYRAITPVFPVIDQGFGFDTAFEWEYNLFTHSWK